MWLVLQLFAVASVSSSVFRHGSTDVYIVVYCYLFAGVGLSHLGGDARALVTAAIQVASSK